MSKPEGLKSTAPDGSTTSRKGWYPNGCPMDGTKFTLRGESNDRYYGVCHRKGKLLVFGNNQGHSSLRFVGDQITKYKGWTGNMIPIDD